jgi:steroid delta-isomerase
MLPQETGKTPMPSAMDLFAMLRQRPGPDHMRTIFDRYRSLMAAGDVDGIAALFALDATWEEPIGTVVERGREAIRARYAAALASSGGSIAMVADGAVRVAGHQAVGLSIATVDSVSGPLVIETANAIACNEHGEITEMKIYFGPTSFRKP